jgi:methylmalonyl-CoA mutase N-terminal domain/subunit
MAKIESLGGAVAALEKGFLQREIEEAPTPRRRRDEDERRIVVGVKRAARGGCAAADPDGPTGDRWRSRSPAARVPRVANAGVAAAAWPR